jgi:uncharacterized membrane-anchored protein YjiN (DUF445 family)
LRSRLSSVSLGPHLGRLLEPALQARVHHRLVDFLVHSLHERLVESSDTVIGLIEKQAPNWTPRFVDRSVAKRIHGELVRAVADVEANPDHPLRRQLDEILIRLVADLENDPAMQARVDGLVREVLLRPEFSSVVSDLSSAGRRMITDQLEDPSGDLRVRIVAGLRLMSDRLQSDEALLERIDSHLGKAAGYVVDHFRDEITRVIADTVERWDGAQTARRIELQVGRDLQYIRVNGTVVGALAGLAIHALTYVL